MISRKRTTIWGCVVLFITVVILLFLKQYYGMPYYDNNSYYNNLELVLNSLNNGITIDTIRGNNHGPLFLIILGHLGHVLNISDAAMVSYVFQFIIVALSITVLSTVLFIMSEGNMILSLIMYVIIMRLSLFFIYIEPSAKYSYWGGMAFDFLCIPLVIYIMYLKERDGNVSEFGMLMVILGLMSLGNIIRQHSAFPTLVVTMFMLLVLLFKEKKRWKIVLGEMVLSIVSFIYIPPLCKWIYDKLIGIIDVQTVERPWHGIWCGLGVYNNPYGFEWNDSAAAEYVRSVNELVGYCTNEYFDILKERVLYVLKEDPVWVIGVYYNKFLDSIKLCMENQWTAALIILFLTFVTGIISKVLLIKIDYYAFSGIMFCILGILAGMIQGVIGYPAIPYILPGIGCLSLLYIFGIFNILLFINRLLLKRKV